MKVIFFDIRRNINLKNIYITLIPLPGDKHYLPSAEFPSSEDQDLL